MLIRIRKKGSLPFRTSQTFASQSCAPGPGTYTVDSPSKANIPAFSIGRSKRYNDHVKGQVGPGSYTPSSSQARKSAIFGTSPKKCLEIMSSTPGPGRYEIFSTVDGPAASIRGKDANVLRQSTPGPGQYYPSLNSEIPSFKFPKQKREFRILQKSPGPGSYNLSRSTSSKGVIFSREKKNDFRVPHHPGPGQYEIPSSADTKAASMKFRHKAKSQDSSPGPAHYEPPLITPIPSNATIGRSKRFSSQKQLLPGPGYYETNQLEKKISAVFGSSKKDLVSLKISEVPGPGEYRTKETIGAAPAYSFKSKRKEVECLNAPGPGSYFGEEESRDKGWKFGKSKSRDFLRVNNKTGPGDYNLGKIVDHRGWSFSSQSRNMGVIKK